MFDSRKSRRRNAAPGAARPSPPPAREASAAAEGEPVLSRDPTVARWLEGIHAMKVEAESQRRLHTFADILAYALAKVAHPHGGEAVGTAVEMLGRHIAVLHEFERAKAEAARAAENGERPH